uniref:Uncharacterized protein n=3 Tax=Ciona intestinalis TaxID=7719 RepID=H2XPX6_CIOIN
MEKMLLHGGFFSMCYHVGSEMEGGPASKFRDEALDEPCKPDYIDPNATIPTTESVIEKTKKCNANGLAKVVSGTVGFFGGVLMAATALTLIPTALMLINVVKPQARSGLFNGLTLGIMYLVLGVLAIGFVVFYQIKIIGSYHEQDLEGTHTGHAWTYALVGGCCVAVAGILSFLIRPNSEVSP